MLRDWQRKYPKCFETYPAILEEKSSVQSQLADILSAFESNDLLSEEVVNDLLVKYPYSEGLHYLISKLIEFHCLNKFTLDGLFQGYISDLAASIRKIDEWSLISPHSLSLVLTSSDPASCVAFIGKAHAAKVDIDSILYFLSHRVAINGLSRAIMLFDLSHFDYCQEYFEHFSVLTAVCANPLCQTIFDARTRGFSDYEEYREKITLSFAQGIINLLHAFGNSEMSYRIFFDSFTTLRSHPSSQLDYSGLPYAIHINVADFVTEELGILCEREIENIKCPQDYIRVEEWIRKLRTRGGDSSLCEQIQYSVASKIESIDMLSSRSYDQHMDKISKALMKPQVKLKSYTEELECKKNSLLMTGRAMYGHSIFSPPAVVFDHGVLPEIQPGAKSSV